MALSVLVGAAGCGVNQFVHVDERALSDEVRVLLGGGGNTLVLLHGGEALVVDPKFLGYARGLQREIEGRWGKRVRRIVLTHFHADHANGAALFRSAGAVLAHPATRARLVASARGQCASRARTGPEERGPEPSDPAPFAQVKGSGAVPLCALPFVDVAAPMRLVLRGTEVQVIPLTGHTDGDVAVYLPQQQILAAGDLVLNGWLPHIDPAAGGNALEMLAALEALLALPFRTVVPGHGAVGGREVVEVARNYLAAVERDVRSVTARGAKTEEEVVAQVPLREEYAHLRPIPGDSHALNVRLMFRAMTEAGKKAAP